MPVLSITTPFFIPPPAVSTRSLVLVPSSLVALVLVLGGAGSVLLSSTSGALSPQCADGFDNDSDGRIDYPNDPDCTDGSDNDEHTVSGSVFVSVTDGKDVTAPGASGIYAVSVTTNDNFSQEVTVNLSLAGEFGIFSASNGGEVLGSLVRWRNVTVTRTSPVTFTVQGTVSPKAVDGNTLVARATAGNREATDTTLIRFGTAQSAGASFDVDISDGETSILPEGDLDYVIRVKNLDNVSRTTDVRATLSPYLAFIVPEGTTDHTSSRLLWTKQSFAPNEERTYRFSGTAIERASRNQVIRISASAGGAVDTDNTTIRSAITPHDLDISVSDGLEMATHGNILTYQVRLQNNEDGTVTDAYVSAALPIYGEFVGANDGGVKDGSNVRWSRLEVPANGSRTVVFSVRVRNDAPLGAELQASASVDGMTEFDRTTVVEQRAIPSPVSSVRNRPVRRSPTAVAPAPLPTSSAAPRSAQPAAAYRPKTVASAAVPKPSQSVLLQKTADKSLVLAGGTVRYRIIVNNVTGSPLSGVTVNDRFNAAHYAVVEAAGARETQGMLEWTLPTLQPGDTWSVSYSLRAAAGLAAGTTLTNLAALNGTALDSVALDKRLAASKVAIVDMLPSTGAPVDFLLSLALGLSGAVPAAVQRKLRKAWKV